MKIKDKELNNSEYKSINVPYMKFYWTFPPPLL